MSNPSEIAAASRASQGLPPKVEDPAACAKVARLMDDYVSKAVDEAPPLSEGQRSQLRRLLSTEHVEQEREDDAAERAYAEARAQGLPERIEDPHTLDRVAALMQTTPPEAGEDVRVTPDVARLRELSEG